MRRLTRRMIPICSAASLLLCAALCVMWVRSYRQADEFERSSTVYHPRWRLELDRHDSVRSSDGTLGWSRSYDVQVEVEQMQFPLLSSRVSETPVSVQSEWREPSFVWKWEPHVRRVVVPYWALVAVTLTVPAACLGSARRRRRPEGHCRNCGYDLRATPSCCPECGTAPGLTRPLVRSPPMRKL